MSDNETTEATIEAPATEAPAEQAEGGVELTIQDLAGLKTIIDVATQRGAFKANEMMSVGTIYNKLETFLNTVAAQAQAQGNQEGA